MNSNSLFDIGKLFVLRVLDVYLAKLYLDP